MCYSKYGFFDRKYVEKFYKTHRMEVAMKRTEFIDGLREALQGKLDSAQIQEQVNYYCGYIEEELRKGKLEEEILGELGDPWIVAKNLEEAFGQESHSNESYVDIDTKRQKDNSQQGRAYTFTSNSSMGCWLFGIVLLICIFIVLYVVSGIFKLLSPILIPVLLALFIIRLFKKRP